MLLATDLLSGLNVFSVTIYDDDRLCFSSSIALEFFVKNKHFETMIYAKSNIFYPTGNAAIALYRRSNYPTVSIDHLYKKKKFLLRDFHHKGDDEYCSKVNSLTRSGFMEVIHEYC